MIDLRDARWIGRHRAIGYSRLLLLLYPPGLIAAYLIAIGKLHFGPVVGSDFLSFWAAARLALLGKSTSVYVAASHAAVQVAAVPGANYFAFFYPPTFLAVLLPLSLLPYSGALIVWIAGTFGAYLAVARRLLPTPGAIWPIAMFPAVYINAANAQNGFVTAVLLLGGLLMLRATPLRAGLLLGCLIIKPHFGLLLPLALAAGGHWRAFAGAAVSSAGLLVLALILFGTDTYVAFLATTPLSTAIITDGAVGWDKMQSAYAAVRLAGGPHLLATGVQGAVSLFAAAAVWWTWRARLGRSIKYAIIVIATVLATPFVFDYDLVLLIGPLCWLAAIGMRQGFLPWERLLMAIVWWLPLVSRTIAMKTNVSVMPLALVLLLLMALRRAWQDRTEPSPEPPAPIQDSLLAPQ